MLYKVVRNDQTLYNGTSIEDAASVAKRFPDAESFTEGSKIEWIDAQPAEPKHVAAVTAKTILADLKR